MSISGTSMGAVSKALLRFGAFNYLSPSPYGLSAANTYYTIGLNLYDTPVQSGNIVFSFEFYSVSLYNDNTATTLYLGITYGTGTAPAANTVVSNVTGIISFSTAASTSTFTYYDVSLFGKMSGLSIGTQYYYDVCVALSAYGNSQTIAYTTKWAWIEEI